MKKNLLSLGLLAALSLSAFGQDVAPIFGQFAATNFGATFPGSTTSNYTALAPITIKRDNGLAIWPVMGCTNGTTAATTVTYNFQISPDGNVWSTTTPLTYAMTMVGTNTITGYKLFPSSVLEHARYVRLTSIVNANTNVVNPGALYYSYFNVFR